METGLQKLDSDIWKTYKSIEGPSSNPDDYIRPYREVVINYADQFAIGFAEWIAKQSLENTLPWTETTAELLELYKASLTPNT